MQHLHIKKGIRSRQMIVEESVEIFNQYGLDITFNQLADYLNVSRGRISHFFTTRDALFVAISEAYQLSLNVIRNEFLAERPNYKFEDIQYFFGRIMDNQYAYRCAIMYAAGAGNSRKDVIQHNNESYRRHRELIRVLASNLVKNGSVTEDIFNPDTYPIFEFQFVSLFTSWVISKEIYYPDQTYEETKPLFLNGILVLFKPYLK